MKSHLAIGILFVSLCFTAAGQDIAVIKGEFVNVTLEKSDSAEVICQLEPEDFFSIDSVDGNWLAISKPTYQQPVRGFVPKSKCQPVKTIPAGEMKAIIKKTFDKELELVVTENYQERREHHEPRFNYILDFASRFIVDTNDSELLSTLIKIVKLDEGSADETPSWWLGWIYMKSPDWTLVHIKKVGTDESLIGNLEWGLENVAQVNKIGAPRYDELKAKLIALK